MRDYCQDSINFSKCCRTIPVFDFNLGDRPVCWANGPMASHEPSRVPPPHDNPAAAGAARPKPLWQPWSDSDDDRESTSRTGENDCSSKELPTRTKKERRRHERHHELLSTAARARKERVVETPSDEVDRPLDMSTGRRASPPPYPAGSSSGLPSYPMRYPSPPDYASARPSVITCASSLRSSPAPSCPSPCGSTSSSASQPRTTGSPPPRRSAADGLPQRREIISSGMCDSVIDEHFRRSLGERYTHLFASSPSSTSSTSNPATTNDSSSRDANKMPSTVNVTGLSVDDHFAKALGETWLKLQSETKEKEANTDSQPGSPIPSSAQRQGLLLT